MSFGWLREWVYDAYLEAVSNCGEWYVHPLAEDPADINPGRRCFTKRGAEKMRNEFDRAERDAVEPIETGREETGTDIITYHSYPVETIWVVGLWQDPPPLTEAEAARLLQNGITADLWFGDS